MQSTVTNTVNNCYLISTAAISQQLTSESFTRLSNDAESQKQDTHLSGRAATTRVKLGQEYGILRHYYRGGMMSRISKDKFLWSGINRTRAVSEYRLLEHMTTLDLPVPHPLAARVIRHRLIYTCDLITREIPNAETLAAKLQYHDIGPVQWRDVGVAIRALHNQQVFHSDLNANNILIDTSGRVTVIDFDKCRLLQGNSWQQKNINRLKRSLDKLSKLGLVKYLNVTSWQSLLEGYNA